LVPPIISVEPRDRIVARGGVAVFEVTASGNDPLQYFWTHDGQLLRDERNAVLNLSNVQEADAGVYSVYVRHLTPDGPVTIQSREVGLTVTP
jgi:hypothetical protein